MQLVNVQSNSEFASHMLNRDLWRDETVKNIIKVGFVLYQVLHSLYTSVRRRVCRLAFWPESGVLLWLIYWLCIL